MKNFFSFSKTITILFIANSAHRIWFSVSRWITINLCSNWDINDSENNFIIAV
ncbi:hypothetical protein H4V97_001384 [Flavobacterium sp. CG_23.5]|uniref:hypothetical protein n=1 Tax=Flavobacterium sp. CG_23.5 TaxID=2760708 RepID=UPI001EC6587F|nr:hypothetical protein [Flavobacterium sp. CG_23.5]MBP2283066.1 hypothetical protein [Flavobacterium sp. CG_23.5]